MTDNGTLIPHPFEREICQEATELAKRRKQAMLIEPRRQVFVKGCPWCGSMPQLSSFSDVQTIGRIYTLRCRSGRCRVKPSVMGSKESVVLDWNNRTSAVRELFPLEDCM